MCEHTRASPMCFLLTEQVRRKSNSPQGLRSHTRLCSPLSQAGIIKGILFLHSSFEADKLLSQQWWVFYRGELLRKAAASGCGSPQSPAHRITSSASPETNEEVAAFLHTHQCSHSSSKSLFRHSPFRPFLLLQDSQVLAPYARWGLYLGHGVLQKASPLSGIQTSLVRPRNSKESGGTHQHCVSGLQTSQHFP